MTTKMAWPETLYYRNQLASLLVGETIVQCAQWHEGQFSSLTQLVNHRILFVEPLSLSLVFHLNDGGRLQVMLEEGTFLQIVPHIDIDQLPSNVKAYITFSTFSLLVCAATEQAVIVQPTARQLKLRTPQLSLVPLDPAMTLKTFLQQCLFKRGTVREVLTNGQLVAGLNECYADEIAFEANIRPDVLFHEQHERWSNLYVALNAVVARASAQGGLLPQLLQPKDEPNEHEAAPFKVAVYKRVKKQCPRCTTPIKQVQRNKVKHYFCPTCQS